MELVAENTLLRQQLIVAQRRVVGRPRWKPWERYALALATRFAPAWRTVTMLVQPATFDDRRASPAGDMTRSPTWARVQL